MNRFIVFLIFAIVTGTHFKGLAAVGFFSQTVDFDYQLVEENIYYRDGYLKNELADSTISNDHSEYGINYLVKFKTGYHHQYFAVLFEYVLAIETEERYNQIDSNIKSLNQKLMSHQINPAIFFQWEPFRVGVGYSYHIRDQFIGNKQRLGLRPPDALSFYFHIHFPELWNRSPIGLGAYYEIAFNPQHGARQMPLFQSAALSFHINFNYLSQFQITFTMHRLDQEVTLFKVENDSVYRPISKDYLARYYVDYTFVHQILKELALRIGIGNMVYSDFESPVLNLNFGITYSFFRI